MKALLISSLFTILSLCLQAEEIYVPQDFNTIQSAIDNASNGDIIIVDNGTYFENISFKGKAITVTSMFHLTNNVYDISQTVIDGSQAVDPEVGSCVRFVNDESETSVLKGFTITGGSGTRIFNSEDNLYFRTGGGILIDHASPTITNNIIENNKCENSANVFGAGGGGIRMGFGIGKIENNIIRNNTGGYAGGIMLAFCNGAVLRNNLIHDNTGTGAFDGGGGVYVDKAPVSLINNTIVNNHSGGKGGGIISTGTTTTITNCIIYGNTATINNPQIYKRFSGNANLTYTCIQGAWNGIGDETGMISVDPQFDGSDKFYLSFNSPCIDSGNPAADFNDLDDGSGTALFPALGGLRCDMGTYGGNRGTELLSNVNSINQLNKIEFIFANPYFNQGIKVISSIQMNLNISVYSIDGKYLSNPFRTALTAGENFIPLELHETGILVFRSDEGDQQSFIIVKDKG